MQFKFINFLKKKTKFNRKSLSTLGFSTFESILLIPAVSALIFGALDVSRILQAYSAVEEGVTSSLRCIYPTDANCNLNTSNDLQARYNFYSTTTNTQWLRQRVRYTAEVSWLEKPGTTFKGFTPTIIGEFEYTLPPKARRVKRTTEVASVNFQHNIMQANSPYIVNPSTLSSNYNATQGLRFVFGSNNLNTSRNYPSADESLDGVISLNSTSNQEEIILNNINGPKFDNNNLPCYRGRNFNNFVRIDAREANYTNSCSTSWIPFTFYLKGEQLSRAGGRVKLLAKNIITQSSYKAFQNGVQPNLNDWVDLGAQTFEENLTGAVRDASFVPRGARQWSGDFGDDNYPEYSKYSKIYAKPGKKIKLKLILERTSQSSIGNEVSWRATSISTFSPVISSYKSKERVICEDAKTEKDCKVRYPLTNINIPINGKIDFKTEGFKEEYRNINCDNKDLNNLSIFSSVGWSNCQNCTVEENPNKKACLAFRDSDGEAKKVKCTSCDYDEESKTCSNDIELNELNPGVLGNPNIQGNNARSEAFKICSITSDDLEGFSASELGATFKEFEISFENEKYNYIQESCFQNRNPKLPDFPIKYSKFKKFKWETQESFQEIIEEKDKNPIELLKEGAFSCFNYNLKVFDSNIDKNLPSESLFSGDEFKQCNCEEINKKRIYSDKVYTEQFGSKKLYANLNCINVAASLIANNPGNLCPAPIPQISKLDEWQLVSGSPFLQDVIPDICNQANISCKSEFLDFIGRKNETSDFDRIKDRAIKLAQDSVSNIAPWISSDCKNENTCAIFDVDQSDTRVEIRGEVAVPLTILGNFSVPISVQRSRVLENTF